MVEVQTIQQYELYLKKQLGKYIKDPKKLNIAVKEMCRAFHDGVRFSTGTLKVDV